MDEIHFSFAKNSELIFTVGGRHLCSTYNPTREGQSWVTDHRDQWQALADGVIVLGMGCGYHVRALKAAGLTRVMVVERNPQIIEAALKTHPLDIHEGDIVHFENLESLNSNKGLRDLTAKSYTVLVHEPSFFAAPEDYKAGKHFLLGRSSDGLKWLLENRGLNIQATVEETSVSLKALDSALEEQRQGQAAVQPLLLALRELIV